MKTIEELREFFKADIFATDVGCVIEEVGKGVSVCSMPIEAKHKNARGAVMGGAIFTLADFAFAVAANAEGIPTVSVSANTMFMKAAKGTRLIARAELIHNGRTTCAASVRIKDDLGTNIAEVSLTGIHLA
ncbi:MAG: PaaI family thioesterase [Ruminococcaceae bacterium]|nr:PaaI family thioesterase [Oscillospiraceae bacterium]